MDAKKITRFYTSRQYIILELKLDFEWIKLEKWWYFIYIFWELTSQEVTLPAVKTTTLQTLSWKTFFLNGFWIAKAFDNTFSNMCVLSFNDLCSVMLLCRYLSYSCRQWLLWWLLWTLFTVHFTNLACHFTNFADYNHLTWPYSV